MIAAQLVGAGAAERKRQKIVPVRALRPKELERLLSEYENRHESDRDRLEAMMHYAQSVGCRVRTLRAYVGEEPGDPGGRCDNCTQPIAKPPPAPRSRKKPAPKPPAAPRFRRGDEVRHRRYGLGKVVEVSGGNVLVAFGASATRASSKTSGQKSAPRAGRGGSIEPRKIREDWLSPA